MRPRFNFDDDDLAETIEQIETADHDEDGPEMKKARNAAREAEKEDHSWD